MFNYFVLKKGKIIEVFESESDEEAREIVEENFPNTLCCVALGDKRLRDEHIVVTADHEQKSDDSKLY